ncbi:MAG: HlyD family efflux transporter periplasmic adaptor subunit [Rhizobiaceae bacterium]
MRGKVAKITTGLALVLALAGSLWWAMSEKPLSVDVATVTVAPMAVTIFEDGMSQVREIYRVSSPVAGNVDRSLLEVGDPVSDGKTVVARINPLQPAFMDERSLAEARAQMEGAAAAVGVAEAELLQARSELELSKADLKRAESLAESRTISQSNLDRARTDVLLKEARVKSGDAALALRKAELASARARLMQPGDRAINEPSENCCVEVTAPINGVVLNLSVKSEQVVQAGAPLAEIGDPSRLEIVADLLSSDAVSISPGTKASLSGGGSGNDIAATVRRVDPVAFTKVSALGIEEQRVNVYLDPDGSVSELGHGFRVRVGLETWRGEKVLQVPVSALFRQGSDWAVFVIEDERAKLRILEIGHLNGETGEVLSGLGEGDSVIVYPSDTVADGTLVEPSAEAG